MDLNQTTNEGGTVDDVANVADGSSQHQQTQANLGSADGGDQQRAAEEKLFTVKIDGDVRQVTLDELLKGYQLETVSRSRMEEAARIREEAGDDAKVASAVRKVLERPNDQLAALELASVLGIPKETVEQLGQSNNVPNNQNLKARGPVSVEDLSPELQEMLKKADEISHDYTQKQIKEAREEIWTKTDKSVESDPVLGRIKDEEVLAMVRSECRREVERRVGVHNEPWPGVLQDILAQARDKYTKFVSGNQGVNQAGKTAIGHATTLAQGLVSRDPVKRVSVRDPNFAGAVGMKLRQLLVSES
jgi:hypothetical protein